MLCDDKSTDAADFELLASDSLFSAAMRSHQHLNTQPPAASAADAAAVAAAAWR